MHNDTFLDDLRAAFTAQAQSLPPTDAQPRYRPRTSPGLLLPAGVALAGVVVAGAAVAAALAGGRADPAVAGPTADGRVTLGLAQYQVSLPEGYHLASGICDIDPPFFDPATMAVRKVVSPDGSCLSIVIYGKPFTTPEGAQPATIGSYEGWTMTGPDGISVGAKLPSSGDRAVITLLIHVTTVDGRPSLEEVVARLAEFQFTWQPPVTTS